MSVHQDSLSQGNPPITHDEEVAASDYAAVQQDSLTMFGAALGGAILGMLLSLLVLAIVNGGTLRFVGGSSRLARLEELYGPLNANVGTLSEKFDLRGENMKEVNRSIDDRFGTQELTIEELRAAISELDETGGQFDALVVALSDALSSIQMAEEAATDESTAEMTSEDVVVGRLSVLFFDDANGNQTLDAGEESLLGISASVVDADGETIATLESTDGGMTFEGLSPGEYSLIVTDPGEYPLPSEEIGVVTISEEGGDPPVLVAVDME
ncbi:MAG: SdrD B-like domain-containing protein [Chloroflexota bacterium]